MLRKLAGFVVAAGMVVTVACGQADSGITANVKSRMATDDTVKAYQVNVDTKNHVVTLTGDVETVAAKERAIMIARETNGVRDVIDQLRVGEAAATSGISGDINEPDVDIAIKDDLEANVDHSAEVTKNTAEKGARATKNTVEKGAEATKNTAEKVGDATVEGAKKVGSATVTGAKKAGHATAEGAKKVGGAVVDTVTDDDHDSDKDGK